VYDIYMLASDVYDIYMLASDVYDIYMLISGDSSIDIRRYLSEATRRKLDVSDPEKPSTMHDMSDLIFSLNVFKDSILESMCELKQTQTKILSEIGCIKRTQEGILIHIQDQQITEGIKKIGSRMEVVETSYDSLNQSQAFTQGRLASLSSLVHATGDAKRESIEVSAASAWPTPTQCHTSVQSAHATAVSVIADVHLAPKQQRLGKLNPDPDHIEVISSDTLTGASVQDTRVIRERAASPMTRDTPDDATDGLEGFTKVTRREKREQYFVHGVKIKDTVDNTKALIVGYLNARGVKPSLVRIIKRGSVYLSLKVNTNIDTFLDSDNFWPEGIGCRKWVSDPSGEIKL